MSDACGFPGTPQWTGSAFAGQRLDFAGFATRKPSVELNRNETDSPSLREQLFQQILLARQRVYAVRGPTPLERLDVGPDIEVWVKREDQPPIHSYKWRGAYNNIASLESECRERGVVCASAGNHAQGVALAAAELGCPATVFMPRPTPQMKQNAVRKHGGDRVTVHLSGDTYDEAYAVAREHAKQSGQTFVHAYDDLVTMGGQGTLADEVVMSGIGEFDVAFLQIGGGGMAASVACWLKHYMPEIRIIGVEGEGQASMKRAVENGAPIELDELDIFCDGTAVRRAGDLTYQLCAELIDEFVTVSNQQVCNAIRNFWTWRRRVVEPAGAIGLAGMLAERDRLRGKRVLTVTCGSNMDFSQLAVIGAETGIGGRHRHHLRFRIDQQQGSLLGLMQQALSGCNIVEFQYGKSESKWAYPVIGFDSTPEVLRQVHDKCAEIGVEVEDVSGGEDIQFRVVHFEAETFRHPLMINYEFPERAGALHEFLGEIQDSANICYFNYKYSGERVGRAIVGLEFSGTDQREELVQRLQSNRILRGRYQMLSESVVARMLGKRRS
ncbi:MAG: pyridoxal-phosphate dependent enzyme [Planctomycetota bacterium]